MNIEIDYREHRVIEIAQETRKVPFEVKALDIGDFILKRDQDVLFVVERKTISDLSASITSGRFREQKKRLVESTGGNQDKIVFVIEQTGKSTLPRKTIDSAIQNLIFKHGFKCIFTRNTKDTFDQLVSIVEKCTDLKPCEFAQVKKYNTEDVFVNVLCCIKGISQKIAEVIKKEIPGGIPELIQVLKCCGVKDISISEHRKVGPAIEAKLKHVFLP